MDKILEFVVYTSVLLISFALGSVTYRLMQSNEQPRQIEATEITKANSVNRNLSVEIKEGERVTFICEVKQ